MSRRRILGSGSVSPCSKRQDELIWVGLRVTALWVTELLCWTRTSLGRGVFATADVARIAVKASAVIRVFMTMLLCNIRQAPHTGDDCTEHDNFVRIKNLGGATA